MGVVEAVTRDLEAHGTAKDSGLAATALALARELDDVHAEQECEQCGHVQRWTPHPNSATSKSMCAKALVDVLRELRMVAPVKEEKDDLSRLRAKRDLRRSAT